jgi:uncharacterized membrane protein YhaH (DUF805 family)
MCFLPFVNGHLNLTATASGSGTSVYLISLTSYVFSKWRSEPCGIRSVMQSAGRPSHPFSRWLYSVKSSYKALLRKPVAPLFWLLLCVSNSSILFFMCSPFLPSEMPASFASCIFSSSLRHLHHRAFFDHELLRLIHRLLLMKYGVREIYLLCFLYEKFFNAVFCSNISLKIQRVHGTYWSLWYLLIFVRQFCTT